MSAQQFTDLVKHLHGFLAREDVIEHMPMGMQADLDQIVTDAEMNAARERDTAELRERFAHSEQTRRGAVEEIADEL